MASRRKIRKAKARKPKPPSEQGLWDMVLDGPVLAVEEGEALSNRICFPFTWGFRTAESTWWLFYFILFFTLWYCFPGYFSTAGWPVPSVTWSGGRGSLGSRKKPLNLIDNFCFGTVPNTAGDKPLDPSDQLPFTIFNHTLLLFLDLAWIVSVQSKMFSPLGSGFNYFFSPNWKCYWFTHKI